MSSLPPYSTYRTDAKQMMFPQATSHGNILSFVPPGFKQELFVKFPDSRLAVCEKCKKNFKTRDMCRVRNTHTAAPWTTAYVCVTIDESCLDENGEYIDKPMTVRMVQWQPYCVKKPFDSKTPVCAACKRTNRTRSFCRDRHKHRHLPWCTVYVLLSSLESADPSTVVAGPSNKVEGDENGETEGKGKSGDEEEEDQKPKASSEVDSTRNDAETISSDAGDQGDDIHDIPESRTFLAKVSCRSISIHWLELAEYDASEATAFTGGIPQPDAAQHFHPSMMAPGGGGIDLSNAASPFYGPGMGYAAQQHQNALKSRQQYFFQMQQHQQQQYAAQQQGQWHHPYGHQPGQEGQHPTAGEAAAAQQQRRGMMEAEMQAPPQPWPMYYSPPPPHGNYPPPPHGHEGPGGPGEHHQQQQQQQQQQHHHHHHEGDQYNAHHDADAEEPDGKRQRV